MSPVLHAPAEFHEVQLVFSCPGKPTDNPLMEEVNGARLTQPVDHHVFAPLEEAQQTIEAWRGHDNREHRAIDTYSSTVLATARSTSP